MKAADLRERSTEDLVELRDATRRELFRDRMKNYTSQLEDTSQLPKARRIVARIESILTERAAAAKGSQS